MSNSKKAKGSSKKRTNKKNNNFSKFIILTIIFIIVLSIILFKSGKIKKFNNDVSNSQDDSTQYVSEIENGVKINQSSALNSAKTVDGITFSNIQLTTKDGMSTFLADAINNSDKKTKMRTVKITLLDKNHNKLVTVSGVVTPLEPGENTKLNVSMTSDFVNAYDFDIEFEN